MTDSTLRRTRPLALLFLVALPIAALTAAAPVGDDDARRVLTIDALRVALASTPPTGSAPASAAAPLADELRFFEERLQATPGDPLALRRLAATRQLRFRAYNEQAELDRAAHLLEELTARYPRDAAVHGMVASHALARHDFPAALTAARARAGASGSDDAAARLGLFDAMWAAGQYADARTLLEGTRTHHITSGRLAREARLVDGLGDVSGARDRMEQVVDLVDAYAENRIVRAWARVEYGNFTLHSGDPDGAVRQYVSALDLIPGYPAALEGLGLIAYGVDHDLAAAEALLERSVRYGSHLDLLPLLAEIATERGDAERAEAYRSDFFERTTANASEERMYWRPLAMALADQGSFEEALRYAEADLAQRQDRGAWATRGWILHQMGRTAEAVDDMDRALAWGSPEPPVLALAGPVYLAAGLERQGRRVIGEALEGRAELGPVAARSLEELLAR